MAPILVSPSQLATELSGPTPPVLLDVRWRPPVAGLPAAETLAPPGRDAYGRAHIPTAVYVDLDAELAGPPGAGGRHPLPDPGAFGAAMRAAGVGGIAGGAAPGRLVVYDERDSTAAARAWWCLRYYGHTGVRVLDGGFAAWRAEGLPVSAGDERPARQGDFVAEPGGMPVLDAAGAADLARSGILLDARAAERYRGEVEPIDPVAGHIPGAVSAPTAENLDADGMFRPRGELRVRFGALGVRAGGPAVGAYCGSGVTAAHEVLALAVIGISAALYVGSWSEWVVDPERPVATGPDPG